MYISEVGKVSPTRKSFRFVRACGAKLRVPAGRCCSLRWATGTRKGLWRVVWLRSCPCLAFAASRWL